MDGTMMRTPLTLPLLLERAGRIFHGSEIVSRLPERRLHRTTYREFYQRARRLGAALMGLGLRRGERVATLMWNHHVHLEAYFGVPCAGGVLHTLNLRLSPDDLAYIVNHARDRFLIVDDVLLPLLEKFRSRIGVERVIVVPLTGEAVAEGFDDYERLLASAGDALAYPDLNENEAAGLCYTSGTTGRPKGVAYSHRALVLHSLASGLADTLGVRNADVLCPVVPMFHVNAWGLPYTGVMVGCKLVFPGPYLDAESLLELFQAEGVTLAAGVPTVWFGILQALDGNPGGWRLASGLRMIVGGAAAPEAMIRAFDRHGLTVLHAWGMTETTPLGTTAYLKRSLAGLDEEARYRLRAK